MAYLKDSIQAPGIMWMTMMMARPSKHDSSFLSSVGVGVSTVGFF